MASIKKAKRSADALVLEQIPNVGPRIAVDLRLIGVKTPKDLKSKNAYKLYVQVCQITRQYHDPCVLDVFLAAVDFMKGNKARDWWSFTDERKANFHTIEGQIERIRNGND